MPVINHTHTYTRHKRDKVFYKCADPDCTHMMKRQDLDGKRSVCAVCGINTLILGYEELKRAFPRCAECSNRKEHREAKEFKKKLEELGIS